MKIILYKNSAEKNRVNKKDYLSPILTLDGYLRTETSIINPSIMVELRDAVKVAESNNIDVTNTESVDVVYLLTEKILGCNYAYIPDFNRWYFVTDITSVRQNLWQLSMSVDVLMSYYGDIMNLSAFIARNQNEYDPLVVDNITNFKYEKEILNTVINHNLGPVDKLEPNINGDAPTVVISYLTDDVIHPSGSAPALDGLPLIDTRISGANLSTQYLVGTRNDLFNLARMVYKNDTLLSFIKSIMVYPYALTTREDDQITSIKIGTTDFALTDTFRYPAYYPDRAVVADFKMDQPLSFRDYAPHTTYEIYIPYCGFVTVSGESILGKHLKVFYVVNWEDGTTTAYIYNVTDNVIIYSAQCVLGVKVALSSSNALELANQKTALGLNTGINLIGSALTIGGGIASGNPLAVGAGILKGTSTIGNAISSFNQMYDAGKVGITSAVGGLSSGQKVIVRETRTVPVGYDDNYFALKGRPLNQYKKLSDLSGFTIVNDVHIENIPNATLTETNEIERLLTSGVIL